MFSCFCPLIRWSFGFVILLINNNNTRTTLIRYVEEVERYYSIRMDIFVYVCCVYPDLPKLCVKCVPKFTLKKNYLLRQKLFLHLEDLGIFHHSSNIFPSRTFRREFLRP